MSKQKHTITDEEFYKNTGVNAKAWEELKKKQKYIPKEKEEVKKDSTIKKVWDTISLIGIYLIVIGLIIFFIWGFFFQEDYRGSNNPDDFVPDYMGGIH